MWDRLNSNWFVAAILCAPALYVFTALSNMLPDVTLLAPDSLSYIQFHPMRTLGYPVMIRLMALISDNPGIFATIQLVIGLLSVIYMCEAAQRVIRNVCVTVPVGYFLITSWPLLEYSLVLLSDSPFFSLVCFAFGAFFVAIANPRPTNLLVLAIFIGMATFVRPLGLVLVPLILVVILAKPAHWKQILLASSIFLMPAIVGQAALNHAVFGYFGLSSAGGYSMAQNTAMLMTHDTASRTPVLRDQIVEMAAPFRDSILEHEDSQKRFQVNNALINQVIGRMGQLVQDYGFETKSIEYVNTEPQVQFASQFKDLSPMNTALSVMPTYQAPQWYWTNRTLSELAKEAHLANLGEWMSWMSMKIVHGWERVIGYSTMPTNVLRPYAVLDLKRANLGADEERTITIQETGLFSPHYINFVPAIFYKLGGFLIAPWVILATGVFVIASALRQLVIRGYVEVSSAAQLGCMGFLIAYHVAISAGQAPIGRYLLGSIAPAYFLLFWGGSLLYTKANQKMRSIRERSGSS